MVFDASAFPKDTLTVAYFSMEIGLEAAMPTYSGGLGILAGDSVKAAADLGLPVVAVTLLHRKGYLRQHLDCYGNQTESEAVWSPQDRLELMTPRVIVNIAGRKVEVQAWRYLVRGEFGHTVPVYFLDTALPVNAPYDQSLTDWLYGGDDCYRLSQQVVLGLGGVAMLRALGYQRVQSYHMNEGHSALLSLALFEEQAWGRSLSDVNGDATDAVQKRCVFTTHTPVPAGHDGFNFDLVRHVLGNERSDFLKRARCCTNGSLNMTTIALNFSRYINGVSMRHNEISRNMFPDHVIDAVTNGVHAGEWTSRPFKALYDRYVPEWRRDNLYLRYAISIPLQEILQAHAEAKRDLIAEVERRSGIRLDPAAMTIGIARRATAYKRSDLLFHDPDRLRAISRKIGPLQVLCAGKAHPRDGGGRDLIRRIFQAASDLADDVTVVYLEEYDMDLGRAMCSGVDIWLNTPQKPYEASGTSGMKAALNGVPSLSVLDGWWIEGHMEGVTGWSVDEDWHCASDSCNESQSLYDKLERIIVPMYYRQPGDFAKIMRSAISVNGSYFNAQRMVMQYLQNAYLRVGVS
ncbi:MAG: alpha-glucan family phosphorylase [Chloroflexi bacterium]|nr:alpha-glucan family phosphorylase [Chloroflexota bacterium]